jgi:hypothetical protein
MATTLGAITPASATAQIAALQQQLAQYQRQLIKDEKAGGTPAQSTVLQLDAAQIALIESEIAQVSAAGMAPAATNALRSANTAVKPAQSVVGGLLNVKA